MKKTLLLMAALCFVFSTAQAFASNCDDLPNYDTIKKALTDARNVDNGGLNLDMWATIVDRTGTVCAVTFTGAKADDQWPASRLISAEKANTANGLSLQGMALSTANLYAPTQPGGPLFGVQESAPVNAKVAYDGSPDDFGTKNDPLVGKPIGGVIVFGGGLALYNDKGDIVGALGVSGDSSCADHNIAWRTRHALDLDFVPKGVSPDKNDNIIYDIKNGKSASGYGHVTCGGHENLVAARLVATQKIVASEKK